MKLKPRVRTRTTHRVAERAREVEWVRMLSLVALAEVREARREAARVAATEGSMRWAVRRYFGWGA